MDPTGVTRDAYGVPHLRADDALALARLQGHVTALDRAWQIEHQRWRMEGRTAEYLGLPGVPWDRFARQVRLEESARAAYVALDDETRAWVDAYVAGVNEGMPLGLVRAHEIEALGLGSVAAQPRPWEPWTPLGIFWAIHVLFGTFPAKLFRAQVSERLGPEWLDLFHVEGGADRDVVAAADHDTVAAADPCGETSGSNAWVVGGHRTASGLPLLAGDPHRTIELPGPYQQVGLACDEFDVVGFTFPGVPGVQHFAHAGSVAWGITNAMADYQDLTIEELRQVDHRIEARGPDGWERAHHHVERITVRNADRVDGRVEVLADVTVDVTVVVTARGPVVTGPPDLIPHPPADPTSSEARFPTLPADHGRGGAAEAGPAAYSLRSPSMVTTDLGFGALLPLLRARTVDDVQAAFAQWVEPVNSVLTADDKGRMRHFIAGRVPRRDPANLALPVPAWDPRHRWEQTWAERPATDVEDVMVSANDRLSGRGLGHEYATPFRANRIRDLIGDRSGLDGDDLAAIHVDDLNGQAAAMRRLVEAAEGLHQGVARVRDDLLAWDGRSAADSTGARLFSAWRHAFVRWVVAHPALEPLHRPHGHSTLLARWLDVPLQVGLSWSSIAAAGDRVGLDIATGVREALERVAAEQDPTRWGDVHTFAPIHPLDGRPEAPQVPAVPLSGDRGCVLAAGSAPGVTDDCYFGPVARYVWDLADRTASRWVVPVGASGVPGDAHFDDQLELWAGGRLLPVTPG